MKAAICIATSFLSAVLVTAYSNSDSVPLRSLDLASGPFSNLGLPKFTGIGSNILGIANVFNNVVDNSAAASESPSVTANKFLQYATPMFSPESISQFLSSPLGADDGNSRVSSFIQQTQSLAKQKFDRHVTNENRRLQKESEAFESMYGVFSNVGKDSFLEGKSPADAASEFLSQITSVPSTAVSSFLSVPAMMQNVPAASFFAQMRDAAQTLNDFSPRRLMEVM